MRPLFIALILALTLAFSSAARAAETEAPVPSVTEVSDETLARIEKLHADAAKLMEAKKPREAVSLYTEILLLEPDDDAAYTNMGQAYLLLGDSERARDAFMNALHIDPDNEVAMAGLESISDPDGNLGAGALHD